MTNETNPTPQPSPLAAPMAAGGEHPRLHEWAVAAGLANVECEEAEIRPFWQRAELVLASTTPAAQAVGLEIQWAADRYNWLRLHSVMEKPMGRPMIIQVGAGFNQTRPALLDLAIDDQRKIVDAKQEQK